MGNLKLELKLRNAPVKITNVEIFGQFILCRVQKLKLSISQRVGQLLIDCICLYSNVAARYVHSSNFSQQTFNSFNLRCWRTLYFWGLFRTGRPSELCGEGGVFRCQLVDSLAISGLWVGLIDDPLTSPRHNRHYWVAAAVSPDSQALTDGR